tara:strand:+ start:453 stop:815 length:363 start_codon:yes stop_codon:yes gene_type:complete
MTQSAAILNEAYNPDWKKIHNFHNKERGRLEKKIKTWHQNYASQSDHGRLKKLQKELEFHHQMCLRCLDTLQHKTVQDYYDWLLQNSELPIEESFLPPKESFKSIEDVRKAWGILKEINN